MIAVSNTTPLRYLIAIGQDDLLGRLFEKVFVPTGVHEELTDPRTPEAVRRNILAPPAWLEIRAVRETHKTEFPVASFAPYLSVFPSRRDARLNALNKESIGWMPVRARSVVDPLQRLSTRPALPVCAYLDII